MQKIRVHFLLFPLLLLFMGFGPFYRQVLKGDAVLFREWIMFRGYGRQVCDVKFFFDKDGVREQVPRLKYFGFSSFLRAPKQIKRLENRTAVMRQGQVLCRQGAFDELLVNYRCGTPQGWSEAREEKISCR